MKRFKREAAALTSLAALVLAGCATPAPPPQDPIRKVAIVTVTDETARADKVRMAAGHPLWIPQDGELSRAAVETITQRLTHARPAWRVVAVEDADIAVFVAKYQDDVATFTDAEGRLRLEVGELLKRLQLDAVFVVTETTAARGPYAVPRKLATLDASVVGWEKVAIEFFDKTRPPGDEADRVSLTEEIIDAHTSGARATLLADTPGEIRRTLDELLHHQGY